MHRQYTMFDVCCVLTVRNILYKFNSGRLIIPCKFLISQQFQLVSTNNTQFIVAVLINYYFV